MSTFDWGFDASQAGGQMIPQDVSFVLQEELRKSQTTAFLTPQNATGLGIQNIKRGYLNLVVPYDSSVVGVDFQTSSTSFVDVSTELRGAVATSGRPVAIFLRGSSTGDPATFTVSIDNRESTGSPSGVMTSAALNGVWFTQPTAGSHTYSVQWKVASGTAVMPRSFRPFLTVVEL